MRTVLTGVVAAAALVVAVAGPAAAGEITGNGKPTPISSYQAGSICSFSGLNDDPTGGGDPFEAGHTQNWGAALRTAKIYIGDGDQGANELAHMILTEGPGTNCRGYASGGGGEP
jgi:hypothetical protein